MFKNLQIFHIAPDWNQDMTQIESAISASAFIPCGASQERSIGWIAPRGEAHGALVESIDGQWILKIQKETKIIPGSVVKDELAKKVAEIEATTGRRPGKKESREIRDDVRLELMSKAFTKISGNFVWINKKDRLLVIDCATQSGSDPIITLLVKALDGFTLTPLQTKQSPMVCMSSWLQSQEMPSGFTADRDCVLKASDESKSSIRYARHALDIDEIRAHIAVGKTPVQLAMTWNSMVSFMLTESGGIKKLDFLDAAMEGKATGADSGFDADVAISTGLLQKMIPELIDSLGGSI